jgi:hypothetical protein
MEEGILGGFADIGVLFEIEGLVKEFAQQLLFLSVRKVS